jgi:hypothetical protein
LRARAAGGLGRHALLHLLRALGRPARPFAQAPDLASLAEVEERQYREGRDRRHAGQGADLLELARDGEGEDEVHVNAKV